MQHDESCSAHTGTRSARQLPITVAGVLGSPSPKSA